MRCCYYKIWGEEFFVLSKNLEEELRVQKGLEEKLRARKVFKQLVELPCTLRLADWKFGHWDLQDRSRNSRTGQGPSPGPPPGSGGGSGGPGGGSGGPIESL